MYDKQAIPIVSNSHNFRNTVQSNQSTPLTNEGFSEYTVKEAEKKVVISHAGGPITGSMKKIHQSVLGMDTEYNESVIANWTPHMSMSVADDSTGAALSAAQIDKNYNTNKNWTPHFFVNPMQDLDYIVIEAMMKNTFIGPLMDSLTRFIIGTGFKPELQIRNPYNDPEKNEAEIEANQEIIDTLNLIDDELNHDESDNLDVPFDEKIAALIDTTNAYNRSALIFGYEKPVEVKGKKYKQIPSSLKFAHARDLGIIKATPDTWRLEAVQWRQAYNMIPAKDMIYLWNPLVTAKYHNAWLYGGSMALPMIDASRVIRKIIGVDFPAMAEATWAGMFVLAVKPQGQDSAQKIAEYSSIANNLTRGGPNILMEDPEDISFNAIDFQPKVMEFKDLTEFLLRYCVSCLGLPQSMFLDESESNRATMLGKIQLATSTVINPLREALGRQISAQWYQRWFRLLFKDTKPEIYKKFRIKMVFDDLHVEEWSDKVESVNELDSRHQLSDSAYGEFAGIENYQNKVEPNTEVSPGGDSKKFNIGEGVQLKKKKEKR